MANTYLSRASYGTPTSTKIFTFSCWVKKAKIGSGRIFDFYAPPFDYGNGLFFTGSDQLGLGSGDTGNGRIITNRVFRDTSAWYHIVAVQDTTNATASDRLKLYVNGERETSFSASVDAVLNAEYQAFRSDVGGIGTYYDKSTSSEFFDGEMSHVHFIDGTAYDASAFGETDANGVWKIITEPSVTYGTNGFFILKNGNSVTDQSGNSNNFTVGGGTLTNTEDNPSNVFATFNALAYFGKGSALENGNTRAYGDSATSNNECSFTTLTGSSGKYYAEFKIASVGTASFIGISDIEYTILENNDGQYRPFTIMVQNNGTLNVRGSGYGAPTTTGSWSSSYTTNDILQVAMDLDNNYFYFGKNGTWQNSGVPSSGATGTGGVAITSDKNYAFTFGGYGSSPSAYANFGNGYFGTTAVSSAGTNASGIGIFEYDVPTGYTALSTKGLNL
jgi:hypothetical protein